MTHSQASKVRAAVRAVLVCVTAFGLGLSAEQVAALQLVAEAALQMFVKGDAVPASSDDAPAQ
jgi:hypothetical protein